MFAGRSRPSPGASWRRPAVGPPPPAPPSGHRAVSTRVVASGAIRCRTGTGWPTPRDAVRSGLPVTLPSRKAPRAPPIPAWWRSGPRAPPCRCCGTNCHLSGDQLSISGAVADGADNTSRAGQCLRRASAGLGTSADQMAAADLVRHLRPASFSWQDGADDIDFSALPRVPAGPRFFGAGIGLGHCLRRPTGPSRRSVAADLANVRTSLAHAIETLAPHASTIAVLDYYQPIPEPSQIAGGTARSRLHTNLVCSASAPTPPAPSRRPRSSCPRSTTPLPAPSATRWPTTCVNVYPGRRLRALDGHGMCTAAALGVSGEAVPDMTLAADAEHIVAAKACSGHGRPARRDARAGPGPHRRGRRSAAWQDYGWRAADPTAAGQRPRRSWSSNGSAGRARSVDRLAEGPDEGRRPVRPLFWSNRRTNAEPTTTPSATSHTWRRLIRRRHADAHADRHVRAASDPLHHPRHVRAHLPCARR